MIEIKTAGLDRYLEGGDGKLRLLVFGAPGAGKTPWAAQFPDPIFLMADRGGEDSLAITNTPYIEIRSEADFEQAMGAIELDSLGKNPRFKTVVLDTISVYQKHIQQDILRRERKASMDDFREWGELSSRIQKVLHRLQQLDMNIVVLCHTKDKFESEELEPDLTGGAKVDLPKEFPYIGWMHHEWGIQQINGQDTRVSVRKIRWRATPKMPNLRSAANVLPEETSVDFKPTDFTQLTDAIRTSANALGVKATTQQLATPADAEKPPVEGASGPVEVAAEKLPKARAGAKSRTTSKAKAQSDAPAAKAAQPDSTEPAEASPVETVQTVLGGEVIEEFDLAAAISAVTADNAQRFVELWKEHKPDWTDEHSALVKARKAELGL